MFIAVKFRYIDVREARIWILKSRFGCSRKIAVTSSNSDDQIGFSRHDIRARRSGDANRAQWLRMIVRQRSFTRLGFTDRNTSLLRKGRECFPRFRIKYSSARYYQGLFRGTNPFRSGPQEVAIATISRNCPYSLLQ